MLLFDEANKLPLIDFRQKASHSIDFLLLLLFLMLLLMMRQEQQHYQHQQLIRGLRLLHTHRLCTLSMQIIKCSFKC